MDEPSEMMHEVGSFEASDAKLVLARLEQEGIAFELEEDNTALADPNRHVALYFGMGPEGAKLRVFVAESQIERALAAIKTIYPV